MKLIQTTGAVAAAALVASLALAADKGPSQDDAIASGTSISSPVRGTVTGSIVFDGKKKEPKPLVMSAEQAKGCCPEGTEMNTVDRSLLIDDKGGISNVVVTLDVAGEKLEVPKEPVPFDQKMCRFEPHVKVIPAEATLVFLNSDAVSHNIHTYAARNEGTNQTVAPGGEFKYKLTRGESVKITCDIHPWMLGWVYVSSDNRWAVSASDGSFTIADVPAGEYKLTIWHEQLGKARATVVVAEDGSSEPVKIKMGKKKAGGRRRR